MKKYTLKRNKDFVFLFGKGKRAKSRTLVMLYHRSRSLKVGYSVSKRHGKSVVRNRIKRLLRASFLKLRPNIKPCYNIVFLPKVSESYDFHCILSDMLAMLKSEGMLNEKGNSGNFPVL